MDNELKDKMTVLEGIILDISKALFERWSAGLPEDQKNDDNLKNLNQNSVEATYFVIQLFMKKFNEAAESLKPIDNTENI
jgi:hypothetical protein